MTVLSTVDVCVTFPALVGWYLLLPMAVYWIGKAVLLLGDTNLDHTNPEHKKKNEARDLLSIVDIQYEKTPIWSYMEKLWPL